LLYKRGEYSNLVTGYWEERLEVLKLWQKLKLKLQAAWEDVFSAKATARDRYTRDRVFLKIGLANSKTTPIF
jgi:hypothetical protein